MHEEVNIWISFHPLCLSSVYVSIMSLERSMFRFAIQSCLENLPCIGIFPYRSSGMTHLWIFFIFHLYKCKSLSLSGSQIFSHQCLRSQTPASIFPFSWKQEQHAGGADFQTRCWQPCKGVARACAGKQQMVPWWKRFSCGEPGNGYLKPKGSCRALSQTLGPATSVSSILTSNQGQHKKYYLIWRTSWCSHSMYRRILQKYERSSATPEGSRLA